MGYEDFTTFTEVDDDSKLTRTATRITWAIYERDDNGYFYKDYGAGHFGDFEHWFDLDLSAVEAGDIDSRNFIDFWAVAALGARVGGQNDYVCVRLSQNGSTDDQYVVELKQKVGGVWKIEQASAVITNLNAVYFIAKKSGATVYLDGYSTTTLRDLGGNGDVVDLSGTGNDETYQYIVMASSTDSTTDPSDYSSGFVENLDIKEAGEYEKTLSEIVGLVDTIATQAALHKDVSELVGLVDTIEAQWGTSKEIIESMGLVDTIKAVADYQKPISELLGLVDTITTQLGRAKTITEFLGLKDTIELQKTTYESRREVRTVEVKRADDTWMDVSGLEIEPQFEHAWGVLIPKLKMKIAYAHEIYDDVVEGRELRVLINGAIKFHGVIYNVDDDLDADALSVMVYHYIIKASDSNVKPNFVNINVTDIIKYGAQFVPGITTNHVEESPFIIESFSFQSPINVLKMWGEALRNTDYALFLDNDLDLHFVPSGFGNNVISDPSMEAALDGDYWKTNASTGMTIEQDDWGERSGGKCVRIEAQTGQMRLIVQEEYDGLITLEKTTKVAQTFKAPSNFICEKLGIRLQQATGASTVRLELWSTTGASHEPNAILAANAKSQDIVWDNPGNRWIYGDLIEGQNLTQDTYYALVIVYASGTDDEIYVHKQSGNPYADGSAWDGNGTWTEQSDDDCAIRVYKKKMVDYGGVYEEKIPITGGYRYFSIAHFKGSEYATAKLQIDWLDIGDNLLSSEYVESSDTLDRSEWTKLELNKKAPAKAAKMTARCYVKLTDEGVVRIDDCFSTRIVEVIDGVNLKVGAKRQAPWWQTYTKVIIQGAKTSTMDIHAEAELPADDPLMIERKGVHRVFTYTNPAITDQVYCNGLAKWELSMRKDRTENWTLPTLFDPTLQVGDMVYVEIPDRNQAGNVYIVGVRHGWDSFATELTCSNKLPRFREPLEEEQDIVSATVSHVVASGEVIAVGLDPYEGSRLKVAPVEWNEMYNLTYDYMDDCTKIVGEETSGYGIAIFRPVAQTFDKWTQLIWLTKAGAAGSEIQVTIMDENDNVLKNDATSPFTFGYLPDPYDAWSENNSYDWNGENCTIFDTETGIVSYAEIKAIRTDMAKRFAMWYHKDKNMALDLTGRKYIEFIFRCDNIDAEVTLRLHTGSSGNDYFEYVFKPVKGFNHRLYRFPLSAFVAIGSPDITQIDWMEWEIDEDDSLTHMMVVDGLGFKWIGKEAVKVKAEMSRTLGTDQSPKIIDMVACYNVGGTS